MGLTGHLALAFNEEDMAKVITMLAGDGEDDDGDCIRYQPSFDLIREDNYEVHRTLETVAEGMPQLERLGTVVKGSQAVSEAGMGIQYYHSAEAVRHMAEAYSSVTPEALAAAIEKIRPEFDPKFFVAMPAVITEKFATIRDELSVVANNG